MEVGDRSSLVIGVLVLMMILRGGGAQHAWVAAASCSSHAVRSRLRWRVRSASRTHSKVEVTAAIKLHVRQRGLVLWPRPRCLLLGFFSGSLEPGGIYCALLGGSFLASGRGGGVLRVEERHGGS
jgi:hypothetical protein